MRRVLITGGAGLLGSALIRLAPPGTELHGVQRRTPVQGCVAHTAELSDAPAVLELAQRLRPDLVIHTAYGKTDGERDIVRASQAVTDACRAVSAPLIHISSDMVLNGEHAPYAEDAAPEPNHQYGRWKARAEAYVRQRAPDAAVVRTSLIISLRPPDASTGWILRGLRDGQEVTLFTDEIRTPILRDDLAAQIWEIAQLPPAERSGVWNLAGPEALSRYALGLLVAAAAGRSPAGLRPGSSESYPEPRPRDLRLLTSRADAMLRSRARPISAVVTGSRLAGEGDRL